MGIKVAVVVVTCVEIGTGGREGGARVTVTEPVTVGVVAASMVVRVVRGRSRSRPLPLRPRCCRRRRCCRVHPWIYPREMPSSSPASTES